jgi:tetratricopeptide (TPR) repeat protein
VSNRQIWVVLLLLVAILAAIAYALSRDQGERRRISDPGQFRAKPGTQRAEARPLSSRRTPSPGGGGGGKTVPEGDTLIPHADRVVLAEERAKKLATDTKLLITETLRASTPPAAIARLKAELAREDRPLEAVPVYLALEELYRQADPPNIAQAEEALERAAALAESESQQHAVALARARRLHEAGDPEGALGVLDTALSDATQVTAAALQMRVLQGELYEDLGDDDSAMGAYQSAVDEKGYVVRDLGADAEPAYRLACLRLARMYRSKGQENEAKAVARKLKAVYSGR